MNPVTGWSLVILSAVSLGVANFVYPHAARSLGAANATLLYYILATGFAVGCWRVAHEPFRLRWSSWHWPLYLAIAMFISNIAYGCGTKHVPNATIPSVIRNCSFFVTAILAMALGREHVTGRDWVAMTLVAAGMALLAWDHPG